MLLGDACKYFLEDYHDEIHKEIKSRWNPDSDLFEENLNPLEFCRERMGACKADQVGLNHLISTSERKTQALEAEAEEKKSRKKRVKVLLGDDEEDEDEWGHVDSAMEAEL